MDNQKIGFIGLGAMGDMVANLLNAGFQVCSYVNRSRGHGPSQAVRLEEVANAQEVARRSASCVAYSMSAKMTRSEILVLSPLSPQVLSYC